ncbi:uncharacterized protein DS421_3g98260 [Arachis hypogaea]|nr:uncharacterized protein DS421_3g98260 [Arachis hypogaea]
MVANFYPQSPSLFFLFPKFLKFFITRTAITTINLQIPVIAQTLSNGGCKLCSASSISWERRCCWSISMPFGGCGTDFSSTKQTRRLQVAMEQGRRQDRSFFWSANLCIHFAPQQLGQHSIQTSSRSR